MYSHYRRGLFALGATVGLLALAGTASASVPGAQRVDSPPSLTNSVPVKFATATCPAGKQVTGVGGEITGGFGEVSMNRLEPDATLKSVTVRAEEVGGNSGRQWSVQAYAMCANTIAGSQRVSVSRVVRGTIQGDGARAVPGRQAPAGCRRHRRSVHGRPRAAHRRQLRGLHDRRRTRAARSRPATRPPGA